MSGRSARMLLVPGVAVAPWPASGTAPGLPSTAREANNRLTPKITAHPQDQYVVSYHRPTSVGGQVHFEVVPPPPA